MKNLFGRTSCAFVIAIALCGGVSPAAAQEQSAPKAEAEDAGEIIVTGIRGSLQRSAEIKKESSQIVDVITAEDVGKLPDANVAEALQRVTGVQITRVFGEGQAVNIRGLQQVRVEVDGRTLLGFSARVSPPENDNLGRSSGLDSVPSSLFGRLEVRKSPLSSQVEGGLGGTVNLVTPKPFDFKKTTVSIRAQGTFSDEAEKFEPNVSGLFTKTFADGDIGILISGEYQKRTSKLQLFERNNFFSVLNGQPAVTNGQPTPNVLVPRLLQYENTDIDRSRLGINGAVQFRVADNLVITADGLYSEQKANRTNQFIALNLANTATGLVVTNPVIENGVAVAGRARGNIRTGSQIRKDPTEGLLFGLNAKYNDGAFKVDVDGYYSKGTLRQKIEVITLQTANNAVEGVFDFRNSRVPDLRVIVPNSITAANPTGTPFNLTSTANFPLPRTDRLTYRANLLPGDLEEWTSKVDVGYDFDNDIKISAGARFVRLKATSEAFRSRANGGFADTVISGVTVPGLNPFLDFGPENFLLDIPGNFPRAFLTATPNAQFVLDRVLTPVIGEPPLPGDPLTRNAARDYNLLEQTISGYLMFDAAPQIFGRPAKFNAGVRITNTDFAVDTLSQVGTGPLTPQRDTNRYTNVLPSANLTVNVTDKFLARVSASRTLQRAGIADLAPSTFVDATNRTSTGGNAQLTPPISTNLDASFEYYTGRTSLISAAVFYKDVKDFIITNITQQIIPGFVGLGTIRVQRPENVASAKVKGFELGIQQFFDFLPSPFDGIGVIANYTYADSKDSNGFPLVATSKNSYNLIGLYEKGRVSGRIAYNYRSNAVFEFTEGRPDVIGARSQLDAQLGFDITKKVALSLQAQNLVPKKSATVEFSNFNPTALNSFALSERRYTIGLRAKF
jgi:iron complex outermembrane recepter protein